MDYISDKYDPGSSPSNYLELTEQGMLFFILNILIHDLSHDFTKERLGKKMARNSNKVALETPQPSASASAPSEDISDLDISPHYDTIHGVHAAEFQLDITINSLPDADAKSSASAKAESKLPAAASAKAESKLTAAASAKAESKLTAAASAESKLSEEKELSPEKLEEFEKGAAIQLAIEKAKSSQGPVTRSKYRKLQPLCEFVDETRLVVLGKIVDVRKSMRGGRTLIQNLTRKQNKSQSQLMLIQNLTRKQNKSQSQLMSSQTKDRSRSSLKRRLSSILTRKLKAVKNKSEIMKELKQKPYIQRNMRFSHMLKSAFHQAIGETNGYPEYEKLNKYYRVMFELYSSFKPNEQISPLDIFNSTFIKEALVLHLIYPDVEPSALLDAVIQSKQKTDLELKGGAKNDEALKAMIEGFANFSTYQSMYVNTASFPRDLDAMIAQLNGDVARVLESGAISDSSARVNIINGIKKTIEHHQKALEKATSSGRTPRGIYLESLKQTIITNNLKILFEGIYAPCERGIKEDALKAANDNAKARDEARNLPIVQIADKPCKIVKTIARGCLKFVFATLSEGIVLTKGNIFDATERSEKKFNGDIYTGQSSPDMSLYLSQLAMVQNIAAGFSQGGDTLDERLLDNMKEYVSDKGNVEIYSDKTGYTPFPPTLPTKYQIINNGATQQLPKLRLDLGKVICPLSSILDPMGSFGSCSTKRDLDTRCSTEKSASSNLFFTTDIYLSDPSKSIAYYGRTQQKNGQEGIIQYGFNTRDYSLPLVVKTVDMSHPNIIDLSVTNTYESILTRIVYSWHNLSENIDNLTVDQLFDRLISNSGLFSDMISGSTIKNCGDLYQELNSSMKYRGYSLNNLTESDKRAKFDPLLIGIHQDRPAASRNMFLLTQGDSNSINMNAIGGYVSPTGYFFVKHK